MIWRAIECRIVQIRFDGRNKINFKYFDSIQTLCQQLYISHPFLHLLRIQYLSQDIEHAKAKQIFLGQKQLKKCLCCLKLQILQLSIQQLNQRYNNKLQMLSFPTQNSQSLYSPSKKHLKINRPTQQLTEKIPPLLSINELAPITHIPIESRNSEKYKQNQQKVRVMHEPEQCQSRIVILNKNQFDYVEYLEEGKKNGELFMDDDSKVDENRKLMSERKERKDINKSWRREFLKKTNLTDPKNLIDQNEEKDKILDIFKPSTPPGNPPLQQGNKQNHTDQIFPSISNQASQVREKPSPNKESLQQKQFQTLALASYYRILGKNDSSSLSYIRPLMQEFSNQTVASKSKISQFSESRKSKLFPNKKNKALRIKQILCSHSSIKKYLNEILELQILLFEERKKEQLTSENISESVEKKKEGEAKLEVLRCLVYKLINKKVRASFESTSGYQNKEVKIEFENEEEHRKINQNQKYIKQLRAKSEQRDKQLEHVKRNYDNVVENLAKTMINLTNNLKKSKAQSQLPKNEVSNQNEEINEFLEGSVKMTGEFNSGAEYRASNQITFKVNQSRVYDSELYQLENSRERDVKNVQQSLLIDEQKKKEEKKKVENLEKKQQSNDKEIVVQKDEVPQSSHIEQEKQKN